MNQSTSKLGVFLLVMLITGSIDSLRNLPASALFGGTLIFFFIFSAIVFLIPAGLVSAELSSTWTKEGGIYDWVRMAFGEKIAFLAIWLQWINTMVWYPTILSFIAGTAAFLIDPALAENKVYLVSVILAVFWILTLLNFKGLSISAKFVSFCSVVGLVIPMFIIIGLGLFWALSGHAVHVNLSPAHLVPHLGRGENWVSLTAIMTAFLGMELATVHVRNVKTPNKTFPKALLISVIFILITMILGSLSIAVVIPHDQINLVDGVMQAFSVFFGAYHLQWLMPIVMVVLLLGGLGGMINWIISPAKGLLRAAHYGYLPKVLSKENKFGVAVNMLVLQAVLVSVVCVAFLLMPSVNGSYWLLTDLSTELYMMMYVLMFLAAIALKFKKMDRSHAFCIPGGKVGNAIVCMLGLAGCMLAIVVGFVPPGSIDVGSAQHYKTVFALGIITMIAPVFLFYAYRKFTR